MTKERELIKRLDEMLFVTETDTDIVERLEVQYEAFSRTDNRMLKEAADEITRLREIEKDRDRLRRELSVTRDALQLIKTAAIVGMPEYGAEDIVEIATDALNKTPPEYLHAIEKDRDRLRAELAVALDNLALIASGQFDKTTQEEIAFRNLKSSPMDDETNGQ